MNYALDELIKIIICDDNIEDQNNLLSKLKNLENKKNIKFGLITIVNNGDELLTFLEKNKTESFILFQDVLLEDKNGISIINENRNLFRYCEIIFITHSKDFRKKIYEVSHSYYLEKREVEEFFEEALDLAIKKRVKRNEDILTFENNSKFYRFRMDDIFYIESDKRIVKIQGNNINEWIYCKIDDIEKSLDSRFIRCHKSFIVNYDKIKVFEKDIFIMDDDKILPISKSRRKMVKDTISKLINTSLV